MPIPKSYLRVLLLCLLSALLVLVLNFASPFLTRLELLTLDWRFTARGPLPPDADIVLVTIDEKSLKEEPTWPWPRSYHADLIDTLHRLGAAVVAFDLSFSEPDSDHPAEDAALAAAMRRAGNVLLAADPPKQGPMGHGSNAGQEAIEVPPDAERASEAMDQKTPMAPEPLPPWMREPTQELFWTLPISTLLAPASGVGYADLTQDVDGSYRRALLLLPVDSHRLYPHLALLAAAQKMGLSPQAIRVAADQRVLLGVKMAVPVAADGSFRIDFAGPPPSGPDTGRYQHYSYSEVLALNPRHQRRGKAVERGEIDPEAFRGKIVFVGATARRLADRRPSPYSQANLGLETDANLTRALLEQRYFREPGKWFLAALLLGIGLSSGWVLAGRAMLRGTVITLFAAVAYGALSLFLFSQARLVLPIASPLVTLGLCYSSAMAYRFQEENRERVRYQASLEQMESERMRHELEIGRTIQASLLPRTPVVVGEFEISAEYHPATEVGGDFYNVFPLYDHASPAPRHGSDGPAGPGAAEAVSCAAPVSTHRDPRVATCERAAIVIGDVAGKGVQAAMFMTVATTLLEELARQGLSPAEALVRANERLYPKLRPHRMFVTLLYGVLDPATGQFTFASAGQTGPILCPRDGPPRFLQQSSLPLAAMPSVQYEERSCVLEAGDALVFVSDGLIEAHATGGAPLGYAGLLEVVARTRDERPERWLERLWEAVANRQATDRDDATTIVVQRRSGLVRSP